MVRTNHPSIGYGPVGIYGQFQVQLARVGIGAPQFPTPDNVTNEGGFFRFGHPIRNPGGSPVWFCVVFVAASSIVSDCIVGACEHPFTASARSMAFKVLYAIILPILFLRLYAADPRDRQSMSAFERCAAVARCPGRGES
jgi:hypothetical protein